MSQILSLSSQVIDGHVGHGVAPFVWQQLGHDVWAVPTVLFSSPPGHGAFAGIGLKPGQLRPVIEAMDLNERLEQVDLLVTGYLPSAELVDFALEVIALVRAVNPAVTILCDPILGDQDSGLYIPEAAAAAIRDRLLAEADIVTPNYFELCWLAGTTPVGDAGASYADLHRLAEQLPGGEGRAGEPPHERLTLITSVPCEHNEQLGNVLITAGGTAVMTSVNRYPDVPKGTGDFFAAMFAGDWLSDKNPRRALARATAASDLLIERAVADYKAMRLRQALIMDEDDDMSAPVLPLIQTRKEWLAATDWPLQAPHLRICV